MSLTLVITRDVEARYRGFLGSCMLEVDPGVYVNPRLNRNVRQRLWDVVENWHSRLARGSILMIWYAKDEPGGIGMRALGTPQKELVEVDNLLLAKRSI